MQINLQKSKFLLAFLFDEKGNGLLKIFNGYGLAVREGLTRC